MRKATYFVGGYSDETLFNDHFYWDEYF